MAEMITTVLTCDSKPILNLLLIEIGDYLAKFRAIITEENQKPDVQRTCNVEKLLEIESKCYGFLFEVLDGNLAYIEIFMVLMQTKYTFDAYFKNLVDNPEIERDMALFGRMTYDLDEKARNVLEHFNCSSETKEFFTSILNDDDENDDDEDF